MVGKEEEALTPEMALAVCTWKEWVPFSAKMTTAGFECHTGVSISQICLPMMLVRGSSNQWQGLGAIALTFTSLVLVTGLAQSQLF